MVQPLWKMSGGVLRKLKIKLPCNLSIPFLSIYPKELKLRSWWDTFTPMFMAALFTIVQFMKTAQIFIDRWINKENMAYTYKKKEILLFLITWMDLEENFTFRYFPSFLKIHFSCIFSLAVRLFQFYLPWRFSLV